MDARHAELAADREDTRYSQNCGSVTTAIANKYVTKNITIMRINTVLTIIAIAMAVLIGYLAFSIAEGEKNDIVCGIASTTCFTAVLVPIVGLQYDSNKLGINIKIMSSLFLFVFLISHFCFAAIYIKMPYYIIINGILLLIYIVILYRMNQIKKL